MSRSPRSLGLVALLCALGVVVLVIGAWAIDRAMHSGQAMRNVSLEGRPVGGLSETELWAEVQRLSESTAALPVRVETPAGVLDTDAATMGFTVDEEATVQRVLDAGRGSLLAQPFEWIGSIFAPHQVEAVYGVDSAAATTALGELDEANFVAPVEPTILLADDQIALLGGVPGTGLHTDDLERDLVDAALAEGDLLVLVLETAPVPPIYADADVQAVAAQANDMTDTALTVSVDGQSTAIEPGVLRTWMRAVPNADESALVLGMDNAAISADVGRTVGAVGTPATQLTWNVDGLGGVSFIEGTPGTGCCAEDSADRIVAALESGATQVQLDLTTAAPLRDAAWAQSMGITTQIASFTTNHGCCENRVENIHRMADMVRGTVIEPGATFSLNDHVGQRTAAKGYVEAGVIYAGRFTTDIGGGVSQFTTTLFNAAFFGGMDFEEYQAHTIYISRYPYGREATLSFPKPDLKITNTTPYGILLWPTYTGTSITVSLYSTPWVSGDQTGQSRAPSGRCTKVTTERTRTWVSDGRTEVDTVTALYQPAEGVLC